MTGKRNPYRLGCCGYSVDVPIDGAIRVKADFVLYISGRAPAPEVAEGLRRLAMFLNSGDVQLIAAQDRPRCFYCGTLNDIDAKLCSQCGAAL